LKDDERFVKLLAAIENFKKGSCSISSSGMSWLPLPQGEGMDVGEKVWT